MVRFNGYYIYEPVLHQEREDFEPWYFVKAYLFYKNGTSRAANKFIKNQENNPFSISDFKDENSLYNFYFTDKEICLKENEGQQWEASFYYDKISENEFKDRQTGKLIKFIPWITTDNKVG